MLTLKDISLHVFIEENQKTTGLGHDAAMLLLQNGITDCEELARHMQSNDSQYQNPIFFRIIQWANYNLERINKSKKEPMIFTFDSYAEFPELKDKFISNDLEVSCDVLPNITPIETRETMLKNILRGISIKRAKEHLGYIAPDLRNSFANVLPGLYEKFLPKIVNGIRLYDEQVIRTVKSNPRALYGDVPVFYTETREKQLIVDAMIEDIVLYICSLDGDLLWGKFSDVQKKKLKTSLLRDTDLRRKTLGNFIQYIANYVTLQELEEGILENGTLKRFVMQPVKKNGE